MHINTKKMLMHINMHTNCFAMFLSITFWVYAQRTNIEIWIPPQLGPAFRKSTAAPAQR